MVLPEEVENELSSAQEALSDGNIGKARVCARRAVGNAFRLSKHFTEFRKVLSAIEIVKLVGSSETFSLEVRKAALRLSASVTEGKISEHPVKDALVIIEGLLL